MDREIKEKIIAVLCEHAIAVNPEAYNEPFALDSIEFISILVSLEQELQVQIADEDLLITNEYTLEDFFKIVEKNINNMNTTREFGLTETKTVDMVSYDIELMSEE